MDGARSADADAAAELGAGETEMVAEHPQERCLGIAVEGSRGAIDVKIGFRHARVIRETRARSPEGTPRFGGGMDAIASG